MDTYKVGMPISLPTPLICKLAEHDNCTWATSKNVTTMYDFLCTGCGLNINRPFSTQRTLVVDLFSNMFVKLVTLALCLSSALAIYNGPLAGGLPASLYPAGVSPQACPNFPNCANPAVAANPDQAQNQWGGQQQWNQQQQPAWTQQPQNQWGSPQQNNWNPQPVPQWNPNGQNTLDKGGYTGDGDYHGEGLAEALAPGYENAGGWRNWDQGNNNNANQWNSAPQWNAGPPALPNGPAARIPAGVDPGSCPNYPFCGA